MKFIHVVRNPFDMVASSAAHLDGGHRVETALRWTHERCAVNHAIAKALGDASVLTVWHEAFVGDVVRGLDRICAFVGLEAPQDYLRACAAIVRPAPHKTRFSVDWTPALRKKAERIIDEFPFMTVYRGDGPGGRESASLAAAPGDAR